MDNIFTIETIEFIQNEMCINPQHYINKIKQYDTNIQKVFRELGMYLLEAKEDSDESSSNNSYSLEAYSFLQNNNIQIDILENESEIADIIVRAFSRYKKYGLLELYTGAESDSWDPLPNITKSLYNQMPDCDQKSFNDFDEILTIYRGTSYEEYETFGNGYKNENDGYSQSWTLCKEWANYFAYELGREKYTGTKRAIIKSQIHKSDIYAYIALEKECIINSDKLIKNSVSLINSKIFTID